MFNTEGNSPSFFTTSLVPGVFLGWMVIDLTFSKNCLKLVHLVLFMLFVRIRSWVCEQHLHSGCQPFRGEAGNQPCFCFDSDLHSLLFIGL